MMRKCTYGLSYDKSRSFQTIWASRVLLQCMQLMWFWPVGPFASVGPLEHLERFNHFGHLESFEQFELPETYELLE